MNGSLLLFYLSEVGNGKWTRFTDALEVVDARWGHSTHAQQLSMLGHVEFDFGTSHVSVGRSANLLWHGYQRET